MLINDVQYRPFCYYTSFCIFTRTNLPPLQLRFYSLLPLYRSVTGDIARAFQFYQLCRFATVLLAGIMLVNLGLSEGEVSDFEWFLFGVHMLSFFWAMGLKNALLSFVPTLDEGEQGRLWSGLLFLFVMVSVLISGAVLASGLFTMAEPLVFVVFFTLSIPATLGEQYLLLQRRSHALTRYAVWVHLLYLAAVAVGAIWGGLPAVFTLLAAWAAVKLLYTVYLIRELGTWTIDLKVLRPFFVFALPLVGYILLGSGMDVVDGILVRHYFDEADFAKFRYGAKELPISAMLIGALATATIPAAVASLEDSMHTLKLRLTRMMHWLYPLSIVLMVSSPYLFEFFYNDQYLLSATIFNIYLLILVSRVLTPQVVLYGLHKNQMLLVVSAVELLVNFALSLVLLQYYGMVGIAYATVVAYALEKVLLCGYLYFAKGLGLGRYISVTPFVVWSVLLVTVFVVTTVYHG